jgi:hypothetical protein
LRGDGCAHDRVSMNFEHGGQYALRRTSVP